MFSNNLHDLTPQQRKNYNRPMFICCWSIVFECGVKNYLFIFSKLFQRFPVFFHYATLKLTIQKYCSESNSKKNNIRFLETVASVATLVQTTVMKTRRLRQSCNGTDASILDTEEHQFLNLVLIFLQEF